MSNVVTFPASRVGEPEWRSALLAEVIRRTAHVAGPINACALQNDLLGFFRRLHGLTEEQCGAEIIDTLFFMVRSGLFLSNTYDAARNELTLGAETLLTASAHLTRRIYAEPWPGPGDEDDAA